MYMLLYHQAIQYSILTNDLMCPMQSLMARVRINEIPKFLAEDPDEKTHEIIVDDPLNPSETLITSLVLNEVTNYFPSRKPRSSEYEDDTIPHIAMTSKALVWEPTKTGFVEQEDAMDDFRK